MDRFLKNDLALRIVAVVLSVILWLTVTAQTSGPSTPTPTGVSEPFPYSVHLQLDPGMVVTTIDKPTAVVVVHGDSIDLTSLPAEMLSVVVTGDVKGLGAGRHVVKLQALGMPPVNYTISPSTVTVVLGKKDTVNKSIQVQVEGNAADGYNVGDVSTDVQTVTVSGVKDAVDQVAYVQAQVSVQGAKQTVTKVVDLRAVDSKGNPVSGVDVSPSSATVTVPVQSPRAQVSVVPQISGVPAAGFAVADVSVSPTLIQVAGTPAATSNMTSVDAPVDVTGFRKTQTVRVDLPLRTGITALHPHTIAVTVTIEPVASKTLTGVPVTIQNVPTGEKVSLSGIPTVTLSIAGPKSIIDKFSLKDVVIYVDASHLKVGDTSGTLVVSVPDWVQVTQLSLETVPVTVTQTSGGQ